MDTTSNFRPALQAPRGSGRLAHALDVNSDLIAYAMLTFGASTESVNGVPGAKVPGPKRYALPTPAGPEGTFAGDDGGLHAPHPVS